MGFFYGEREEGGGLGVWRGEGRGKRGREREGWRVEGEIALSRKDWLITVLGEVEGGGEMIM